MITQKDYLTASGAYPEREKHKELTKEYLDNSQKLLENVNAFLAELATKESISKAYKVSSGFRPSAVNANTKGSAKKSLHMTCLAIDILDDKDQTLAKACEKHPEILRKYKLFLESPKHTIGNYANWTHLDMSPTRADRPSRVFIP